MGEVKRVRRGKRKKKSIFLRLSLLAFSVYVVVMLVQLQLDIREKNDRLAELDAAIAAQQATNDELEDQNENIDAYKEQKAREQGYAKSDELIIIETR